MFYCRLLPSSVVAMSLLHSPILYISARNVPSTSSTTKHSRPNGPFPHLHVLFPPSMRPSLVCSRQSVSFWGYQDRSCAVFSAASSSMDHRLPSRANHCTLCAKLLSQDTLLNLVDGQDGHMCNLTTSLRCLCVPRRCQNYCCNAILLWFCALKRLRTNTIVTLRF